MSYQLDHFFHHFIPFTSFLSSNSSQNIEYNYFNYSTYIVLVIVWIIFFLIFFILKYFETEELTRVKQIFDDCSQVTSYFKYLIKLKIGYATNVYQRKKASIMIDFLDIKKRFLTRIAISPSWFTKEIPEQHQESLFQYIKILLHRSVPISTVGFIRINHDSFYPLGGLIYVYSLTIRDLSQNIITMVPVFQNIKPCLPDDSSDDHVYKANAPKFYGPDYETYLGQVSPYILKFEYLLFFFLYYNTALLANSLIPEFFKVTSITLSIYNGLIGFGIAFIVTIFFSFFYRIVIKRKYSLRRGTKPWSVIRIGFIYSTISNSCLTGLMACFLQSKLGLESFRYWTISVLVSYSVFFTLSLILFVFLWISQRLKSAAQELTS